MRNHEMQNAPLDGARGALSKSRRAKLKMRTVTGVSAVFAFCILNLALLSSPLSAQDLERITFEEAVRRAVTSHPTVRQAAADVLRAQAVLQQVRARSRPTVDASFSTNIIEPVTSFGPVVTEDATFERVTPTGTDAPGSRQTARREANRGMAGLMRQMNAAFRVTRPNGPRRLSALCGEATTSLHAIAGREHHQAR